MSEGKKVPAWVWLLAVFTVLFALVAALTPFAIQGVRRYMAQAKRAEAVSALGVWGDGLVRCSAQTGRLPGSTLLVPPDLSSVSGKKYQSSAADWAEPAHACAKFSMTTPQYFQYSWELRSPTEGVLHARADLDGNGEADEGVDLPVTCAAGVCSHPELPAVGRVKRGDAPLSALEWGLVVFTAGAAMALAYGGIWLLFAAFSESLLYGLFALLPMGIWLFIIQRWDRAKRPFVFAGSAWVATILGVVSIALAGQGAEAFVPESALAPLSPPAQIAAGAAVLPPVVVPSLDGRPVDLSSVMGRARKLADAWQPEAALLGIEATLLGGVVDPSTDAVAKVTFGPSPFGQPGTRAGLFVVVYDKTGIHGAPAPGAAAKLLPEPMCAPEAVLARAADLGKGPIILRYALDPSQRPLWQANPLESPKQLRLFDPQDCSVRGLVAPRNKR
jgi:hypothetical protein